MAIRSVESLREKLRRDTNPLEMLMSLPATHRFLESVTVEGYEAALDGVEREVAERFIELPTDADGVPIRVGDVLTDGEYKFKVFELAAFGDGSWSICNEDGNAWAACDVTHHHEPTVEDVLREFAEKITDSQIPDVHPTYEEAIAEYAQRLQLREVDE